MLTKGTVPRPMVRLRSMSQRSAVLLAFALPPLQACSNDTITNPPATIAVALDAPNASVMLGGSVSFGVTITGAGGFTAIPTVTVTGMPTGVTAAVSAIHTAGVTSTGAVTLRVDVTGTAGVYPLSVSAAGTGVTTVSTIFTLTVNVPAPALR